MSLSMGNYLENQILNWLFRTLGTWTKPTDIDIALLKTLPSDDAGTGLAEITMTSYARVARDPLDANWSDPSSGNQGETDNVAEIDFGTLTGTGERAIGVAIYGDTSNLWFWGAMATGWFPADVNTTGNVLTAQSHGVAEDTRLFVRNIVGSTGVSQQTEYYAHSVATDTLQLSTDSTNPLTISADGSLEVGISQAKDIGDGDQIKFTAGSLDIALD